MTRIAPAIFLVALLSLALASPAVAQRGRAAAPAELQQELVQRNGQVIVMQRPTELDQRGAEETRNELERIMRLYPPALGRVLKLDPTLMSNPAYLAPYPMLNTFIQRHPEITRYPSWFLSFVYDSGSNEIRDPQLQVRQQAMRLWQDIMTGLMVMTGFGVAIFTVTWLIRFVVGHRRWLRATKIQSEVHGRLMERFSANDELMAYVQSPAGQRFLQVAPISVDTVGGGSDVAAPFSRILWSVQAGLVLGCAGLGMLVIKHYLVEEVGEMMLVFGVLAISIGAGFALAAGASYVLSQRLGLLDDARKTTGAASLDR